MNPGPALPPNFTGPPFIGVILNWGLYGVLSVQVYLYSQVFHRDPPLLRLFVFVLYLLEATQTFLTTSAVWKLLISGTGLQSAKIYPEAWVSICILGGIVACTVQLFYAYKISKLSRNHYVSSVVAIISVISYAGALGSGILLARNQILSPGHGPRTDIVVGIWLVGAFLCDTLIALAMCYYLRKGAQSTPFKSTQRLVSRLIRLTLETGTLTAMISMITMVLFYMPALNPDWQVPLAFTAKLYATTLLALLNSRMNLSLAASDSTVSWNFTGNSHRNPVSSSTHVIIPMSNLVSVSKLTSTKTDRSI